MLKDRSEPEASTLVTVLHQIGSRIPSSEAEAATLRTELIRAGFRSENAAPVFYGIRIVIHARHAGRLPDDGPPACRPTR